MTGKPIGHYRSMVLTSINKLRFVQTTPHTCSYLDNKIATNVFVDPNEQLGAEHYNGLARYGFRRSGNHVYRPYCANCQACIPFRVLTHSFTPDRSQRRCLKRNADLQISTRDTIDTDDCYQLYARYICARHRNGDMYPPDREQYRDFLSNPWSSTQYLVFSDATGKVVSIAVCDVVGDGLSAMYSFFDPDAEKRSLGVFNILYQIQIANTLSLPYLYLGYWIKECQKMAYKSSYKPYELLIDNEWR